MAKYPIVNHYIINLKNAIVSFKNAIRTNNYKKTT